MKRDIYAFELDEKFNWTGKISAGWKSGKLFIPAKGTKFPETPILKRIIEELARIK